MSKSVLLKTILRTTGVWLALICHSFYAHAQFTNINGIVNSYYQVIENIPSKTCVRLSSVAGLSAVDKVMIIQMKGASINTSDPNSASWGDTTALNNAGNYELAYICSIRGDSVFFVHRLVNNYTPVSGKVQLVTVAQYDNARVTDTIKAKPWDNVTGTGAVIAIEVIDTLVLQAPIYADKAGFKGGIVFQHSGNCDFFNPAGVAYVYDADIFGSSNNGAHKGEGIADFTATTDGGKGAPANGGGGGNNHNNSGGGGSNIVAGGRGGGNSSSGPFFCITGNNQGRGGWPLGSWSGKKIFAGGGGGAGHNNNAVFMLGGGDGGGIIFLHADTLISNGYKVMANGGLGGNSQGDGAGGGGGAGTIILDINTYLDAATIEAIGGNGGNSNDVTTPGRCFGGGGGGSGGVVYTKTASITGTVTRTGGTGGIETNRDAACLAAIPGLVGATGNLVNNYNYTIGTIFGLYCGGILPATLTYFRAQLQGTSVQLTWNMSNPELVAMYAVERMSNSGQWQIIKNVEADDIRQFYTCIDPSPEQGDNFYRIRIIQKSNAVAYSPTRYIFISSRNDFTVYPNPATDKLYIRTHYSSPVKLELVDMAGKLLFQKTILSPMTEITLPVLPKAVYALRIGDQVKKLVIH